MSHVFFITMVITGGEWRYAGVLQEILLISLIIPRAWFPVVKPSIWQNFNCTYVFRQIVNECTFFINYFVWYQSRIKVCTNHKITKQSHVYYSINYTLSLEMGRMKSIWFFSASSSFSSSVIFVSAIFYKTFICAAHELFLFRPVAKNFPPVINNHIQWINNLTIKINACTIHGVNNLQQNHGAIYSVTYL